MKYSKSVMLVVASMLALGVVFTTHTPASASSQGFRPFWGCGAIPTLFRQPSLRWWQDCYSRGLVRGTSFIDKNADGKWEDGEPIFGEAWYKVTGGGAWFTCGWVGDDSTFGVPVNPGTYYVLPVAPKGYKTTTPRIQVEVTGDVNTPWLYMGFVADPAAKGDACDQYNPPRS
ncbi:MAG: hypothetical protein M1434_00505 [Chloroflexi bacterium]|nr:hypothetical protein [Chloroflexota bacterium]